MAFGFTSLPTRKYAYGVRGRLRSTGELFPGHDPAVRQMLLAHRMRNELVEVERNRRAACAGAVRSADPRVPELEAEVRRLQAAVETMRVVLKGSNVRSRRKVSDPELAGRIRDAASAKSRLAAARAELRRRKEAAYAGGGLRAGLDAIAAAADESTTLARQKWIDEEGLYWATANQVLGRISRTGPPPRFHAWEGGGTISVQVQAKELPGAGRVPVLRPDGTPRLNRRGEPMTRPAAYTPFGPAELGDPDNTLVRVEPQPGADPRYVYVHFRVGSKVEPRGAPLWAVLPTKMHRPLPADGQIKWVHLTRRRVGTHFKWEVMFDVSRPEWPVRGDRATSGAAGVALGWARVPGGLRVATWVGDDGRSGEVVVPDDRLAAWDRDAEFQALRDEILNGQKAALLDWIAGRGLESLPPELVAQMSPNDGRAGADSRSPHTRRLFVGQWRSPRRMARLVNWWRDHRVPGDEGVFGALEGRTVRHRGRDRYEGGRRQDRHLCDWQKNLAAKCVAWRKDFHARAAIELSRSYRSVFVAAIDWAAVAKNPAAERADEAVRKHYFRVASVASLRDALGEYMDATEVDAAGVAATCFRCGAAGSGECCGGEPVGRALNAANNILRRGLLLGGGESAARVAQPVPA